MIELRARFQNTFVGLWLGNNVANFVLAPGIPQYLDKYHPIVAQVMRIGGNLFVPRYNGTFESSGEFSFKSSVKSIDETIELISTGQVTQLYDSTVVSWKTDNVPTIVLGFSYGGLVSRYLSLTTHYTALICPLYDVSLHLGGGAGEDIEKTFSFVERAYPNMYRLSSKKVVDELSVLQDTGDGNVNTIVAGSADSSITKGEIQMLCEKYPLANLIWKSGGHSLSMDDDLLLGIIRRATEMKCSKA